MPAVEAENAALEPEADASETQSYELAFHVLPTIAEGEVAGVFAAIKDAIKSAGGELFDEEAPERFELAYEVEKHLEGRNRKFRSAYFGWIRFKAAPEAAVRIGAEAAANSAILRHLLIRLTRVEEEHPFRFHDAIRDEKQVTDIEVSEVLPEAAAENAGEPAAAAKAGATAGEKAPEEKGT